VIIDVLDFASICDQAHAHSMPSEAVSSTSRSYTATADGNRGEGVGVWSGGGSPGVALRAANLETCTRVRIDLSAHSHTLGKITSIVALDFSADGRWLLIQLGAPSWTLLRWDWASDVATTVRFCFPLHAASRSRLQTRSSVVYDCVLIVWNS
jgi:hypothetical protein